MFTDTNASRLFVHVFLPGDAAATLCGRLHWEDPSDEGRPAHFEYDSAYLRKGKAIPLDPVRVPLSEDRLDSPCGLTGVLGVFGDAMPDHWGKTVLRHRNAGRPLTQSGLLLSSSGLQRTGNLEFSESPEAPEEQQLAGDLGALAEAIRRLQDNLSIPNQWEELLMQGTSLGGARPKAVIEDDHALWIAKFPHIFDTENHARKEFATLQLAQHCGIKTQEARLVSLDRGREAILVRRFDRKPTAPGYLRHALVSAATVCGWEPKNDRKGYPLFAESMAHWGVSPADRTALFDRMVFNILISNHDDHHKNHALLQDRSGEYRLSPTYDIVAGEGMRRTQAMNVGDEWGASTLQNAMSQCSIFGLTRQEALKRIEHIVEKMTDWRKVFETHNAATRDLEWAILPQAMLMEFERLKNQA